MIDYSKEPLGAFGARGRRSQKRECGHFSAAKRLPMAVAMTSARGASNLSTSTAT